MSNAQAIASLKDLAARMRAMPKTLAIKVAAAAAPVLTGLVRATFAASEDAYGGAWLPGGEGQTVTLRKSGALASTVSYTSIGTIIRLRLGTSYAKYQVGRRPVAPKAGQPLPASYSAALGGIVADVSRSELGR